MQRFLDRDVDHRRRRRSAAPMPLAGRAPDDFARVELDDGFAIALRPAASGGNDQRSSDVDGGASLE